ncbi:MAG: hypothetical protein ACXWCV_00970 [Caldimonas sp.]
MKTITIRLVAALAAAAALAAPTLAQARSGGGPGFSAGAGSQGHWNRGGHGGGWNHRGHWNHGYWGPGPFWWGGLGLGLGLGAIVYSAPYYGGYYAYPGYLVEPGIADYVVVDPVPRAPVVRSTGQPVPAPARAPDPIFYPKEGQTPAKTEADRQDCNRWATTQAGAMSDASIFHRATLACMEGRGYTVK